MEFDKPFFLLLIPFFLLLFCFLWRKGRLESSHYMAHPALSAGQGERLGGVRLIFAKLPYIFLLICLLGGATALAGPLGGRMREEKKEKVHKINLIVDVSGSMDGGTRPGGKIVKVTDFAKDFVKSRKGDLVGVIPFDSVVVESLVTSLTSDTEALEWGLNKIRFYSGGTTAIGEGLFRGIAVFLSDIFPDADLRILKEDVAAGSGWSSYSAHLIEQVGKGGLENCVNIVLTDSGNNSGIDPIEVLNLSQWLGIKTHAVRIKVVEDKVFQGAIRATGGEVFDVEDSQDVARVFKIINELEKKEEVVEWVYYKKLLFKYPLLVSLISFVLMFVCESVYRKN